MAHRIPTLKRRPQRREPKQRFIIFCEGANTEPQYFEALMRHCNNALIEVITIGPAGVPFTMAQKAKERAEFLGLSGNKPDKSLDSFEEADQVWAVFDRDEHPRFDEAIELCNANNVGVGRSDPCFEVWLILHLQDYDKPDGRKMVQNILAKLCPEYKTGAGKVPNYAKLIASVQAAEARAKVLLRRRIEENRPYGCPSTTVGSLTSAIREAAQKHQM